MKIWDRLEKAIVGVLGLAALAFAAAWFAGAPAGARPWLVVAAMALAGGTLIGLGHGVIGFVVLLCSLPGAIVAWVKWNDRSYG